MTDPVNEADLTRRLAALTLKEKVALLTGADAWSLTPLPAVGLEALRLSDGPVGPRGTEFGPGAPPSLLFPSPTSLAATWDTELAYDSGRLMGARAREMGVHVLLAPTVNLHRSPLGGRHFECFSEDPLLTADIAVAFIEGVQSAGVAACVKHFVGNDSETERMSYDARIEDKALREVYLRPFEAAVRKAGVWMVMSAYNGVNGSTMTENRSLQHELLKEEWGFDGVLVSDWNAARSTVESSLAGLDLAMPGPDGPWGDALVAAVVEGRVPEQVIDDKVRRILRLAARVGGLDGIPAPPAPAVPPDARDRLRDLAVRGAVLLRNDGVLPLRGVRRIALIGPNATRLAAQGGGSAHVNPERVVTPLEGLRRVLGDDVQISLHPGAFPQARLEPLTAASHPVTGEPGVQLQYVAVDGSVRSEEHRSPAEWWFPLILEDGVTELVVRARLHLASGPGHLLSVLGAGEYVLRVLDQEPQRCEQYVDGSDIGALVLNPPSHTFIFDTPTGDPVIELRVTPQRDLPHPVALLGLGYAEPRDDDDTALAKAVEAARSADAAVVIVGSDEYIEAENIDRPGLALPGRQDELVTAVCEANPRTVVVVNAGAPWLMPWADRPAAILWSWFPGQECGDAIADILTGTEPGGRLPTTFPAAEAEVPILSTQPDQGVLDYAEGGLIGYRAYADAGTEPLFPFGHGLSYTSWEYLEATADDLTVQVTLRNTGDRHGRDVVQAYLDSQDEPLRLVGFSAVEAGPGETITVALEIDRHSLARWIDGAWAQPAAPHRLRIGRSAAELLLELSV
ncbi:beta-glucosidase family protein [Actinomadura rudentiformis]|uniref:Beta-glucosidase n=1 Tax=Actinomadura rudentiformis TaxID=359158 RepID=A0A6H9YHC0_9ACTN|nr:glycoside hydrolase family 3 protein [Actinomadura rudentiformis]KAB2341609.1 beta-glucosidase [Actinomadura rudentiformis]